MSQTIKNSGGGGSITIQQTSPPHKKAMGKQTSERDSGNNFGGNGINNPHNQTLTALFGGPLPKTSNRIGANHQSNQDVFGQNMQNGSQVVSIQVPHDIERLPKIIQKQFLKGPTT